MKLTIVAATGGVGSQLLRQAVAAGHQVTAIVRDPARLPDLPVRVVPADLSTAGPADLLPAIDGADAVLSGLGARRAAEAGVASRGTRALVQAMGATGVRQRRVGRHRAVTGSAGPAAPQPRGRVLHAPHRRPARQGRVP
jgi:putative NADH-flavin reductase